MPDDQVDVADVDETAADPPPHEPEPAGDAPPTDTPAAPQARELKLVVQMQPDGERFTARLAVGAEGCDPEFRTVDVPDLAAALAALAALVPEAEARWQEQPRYPAAPRVDPPPRPAATTPARRSAAPPPPPTRQQKAEQLRRDAAAAQPSMFG